MQRYLFGWSCREKIDWDDAMVAEGEADLAIVVRRCRQLRPRLRHGDGWGTSRGKRQRVMVPGKQHRLEKDRKAPGSRGDPARRVPWLADPIPREEAQLHGDLFLPPASGPLSQTKPCLVMR